MLSFLKPNTNTNKLTKEDLDAQYQRINSGEVVQAGLFDLEPAGLPLGFYVNQRPFTITLHKERACKTTLSEGVLKICEPVKQSTTENSQSLDINPGETLKRRTETIKSGDLKAKKQALKKEYHRVSKAWGFKPTKDEQGTLFDNIQPITHLYEYKGKEGQSITLQYEKTFEVSPKYQFKPNHP